MGVKLIIYVSMVMMHGSIYPFHDWTIWRGFRAVVFFEWFISKRVQICGFLSFSQIGQIYDMSKSGYCYRITHISTSTTFVSSVPELCSSIHFSLSHRQVRARYLSCVLKQHSRGIERFLQSRMVRQYDRLVDQLRKWMRNFQVHSSSFC